MVFGIYKDDFFEQLIIVAAAAGVQVIKKL